MKNKYTAIVLLTLLTAIIPFNILIISIIFRNDLIKLLQEEKNLYFLCFSSSSGEIFNIYFSTSWTNFIFFSFAAQILGIAFFVIMKNFFDVVYRISKL